MKRILVDVDCVIADLMDEWLGMYNAEYNDTLTAGQITSWGMEEFVKGECGTKIYDYLWLPNLYDYVKPIDGAITGVRWLRRHGFDVRFVTSGLHAGKAKWLGNQGLLLGEFPLYSPDLIVAHDKSIIKADIMIDDNVKNCESFSGFAIVFGQPWNSHAASQHLRADDWADVIQLLARKYSGAL
jgi:5'-nucleotidase